MENLLSSFRYVWQRRRARRAGRHVTEVSMPEKSRKTTSSLRRRLLFSDLVAATHNLFRRYSAQESSKLALHRWELIT